MYRSNLADFSAFGSVTTCACLGCIDQALGVDATACTAQACAGYHQTAPCDFCADEAAGTVCTTDASGRAACGAAYWNLLIDEATGRISEASSPSPPNPPPPPAPGPSSPSSGGGSGGLPLWMWIVGVPMSIGFVVFLYFCVKRGWWKPFGRAYKFLTYDVWYFFVVPAWAKPKNWARAAKAACFCYWCCSDAFDSDKLLEDNDDEL